MTGQLITIAEKMARKVFKLTDSYRVISCNVKAKTIEMILYNGLIELKVKFPRDLIESHLEVEENEEESIEDIEIESESVDIDVKTSKLVPKTKEEN